MPLELSVSLSARRFIAPYAARLHDWQPTAALLLGQRHSRVPEIALRARERAAQLSAEIRAVENDLVKDLASVPPDVANHTYIRDVRKAYRSLLTRLE